MGEAVNVFTKLTIGDGLVSQVPAFLISLAAGLIVTRSSSATDLGRDVIGQLFGRRGVLAMAAVFLGLLAFTPLPKMPLLTLAGGLGTGPCPGQAGDRAIGTDRGDRRSRASSPSGRRRSRAEDRRRAGSSDGGERGRRDGGPERRAADDEPPSERMEDLLHVDPLELEIGYPPDRAGRPDPRRRPARPAPDGPPAGGPRPRA